LIKRFFILFWLISAYAIVFAHSVVPHHHEQKNAAETLGHHHHDTDDHHAEDHDEEAGDTHNTFHLFQHQGATGDVFVPSYKYTAPTLNKDVTAIHHAIQKLIQLCDEGPPLQHFTKRSYHSLLQQEHFYFFSVKAPPVLS
jgi:hypothetical protein